MKICSQCKLKKSLDDYYKNKRRKDGLQTMCKSCTSKNDGRRAIDGSNKKRCLTYHYKIMHNTEYAKEEKERKLQWRRENIESVRAINRKHYRNNKIYYINKAHERRIKLKKIKGSFTKIDINNRFALYGFKCAYCNTAKNLTIDHVIPIFKGGLNFPSNIVPCCSKCNSAKRERNWKPILPKSKMC